MTTPKKRAKQLQIDFDKGDGTTKRWNENNQHYDTVEDPTLGSRAHGADKNPLMDIKLLARKYTREALKQVVDVMRTSDKEVVVLEAAKILFDRAYGKPRQDIAVEVKRSMEDYTDAELLALGGQEIQDVERQYTDVIYQDIVGGGSGSESEGALEGEILGPEDDAGIHEVREA